MVSGHKTTIVWASISLYRERTHDHVTSYHLQNHWSTRNTTVCKTSVCSLSLSLWSDSPVSASTWRHPISLTLRWSTPQPDWVNCHPDGGGSPRGIYGLIYYCLHCNSRDEGTTNTNRHPISTSFHDQQGYGEDVESGRPMTYRLL